MASRIGQQVEIDKFSSLCGDDPFSVTVSDAWNTRKTLCRKITLGKQLD
ncbi:hypothetical protein ACFL4G_09875 [Thermodesulfobacteriota bacterium]